MGVAKPLEWSTSARLARETTVRSDVSCVIGRDGLVVASVRRGRGPSRSRTFWFVFVRVFFRPTTIAIDDDDDARARGDGDHSIRRGRARRSRAEYSWVTGVYL